MFKKMFSVMLALLCGSIFVSSASATVITFTELPPQPVDGLVFDNVKFNFSISGVPSTDATFGGGGPGNMTYIQDPSLEGNTEGVLSLDFLTPVNGFSFGVGLNTVSPLTPGASVDLYAADDTTFLGTSTVNTSPLIFFTEGLFSTSSTVGRAAISFDSLDANRFVIDNLTYNAVPEPSTLLLLGSGLIGFVGFRRKFKA